MNYPLAFNFNLIPIHYECAVAVQNFAVQNNVYRLFSSCSSEREMKNVSATDRKPIFK